MIIQEIINELSEDLCITGTKKMNGILYIYCQVNEVTAKCKYCGQESNKIHSRYLRTISDLPIQNYQVKLVITVPKYFCCNDECPHKTFAYSFDFIEKNSIRTKRLNDYIYQVALKNSSLDAKKQISSSHVQVSNNTVLRILKKKEKITVNYNASNIGIDDFAFLKRNVYYSIIVDNDTHERLDVVDSRQQPEVIKALAPFKNVKTVTRDFSKSYRAAIQKALPNAKQIVDRFHILKILTEHTEIFKIIKEEGYPGQISLYNSKMKGIRHELKHNIRYLKRSDIKKLLFYPLNKIKNPEKVSDIKKYLDTHPDVDTILELVADFKEIILGNEVKKLDEWLDLARKKDVAELNRFIKLIDGDREAVENAIIYHYSNGLTEGHNNKIKLIKRQMYGRCNFDLLRLKILA